MASDTLVVNGGRLSRLQSRPTLEEYIREIWQVRRFIALNARTRANLNGRDTFLGRAWVILDPILQTAFYGFVFGMVLNVSKGMENFPGYLAIGVVFFRVATRGLTSGIGLVRRSRALISSFSFPRAAVVLGEGLKNAIDGVTPVLVGILMALAWQLDKPIPWTVVLIVPIYCLVQLFSLGCVFFVARATAFVPDLKSIVNLFTRALFFLSGIFFSIERFVNHETLALVMKLNPVYQTLYAARCCVLNGEVPPVFTWVYLAFWAFGLVTFGFIYFWAAEGRYANVR